MMKFMNDDFLLHNSTAKELYKEISHLPIIDYHCHLDPAAIANNHRFQNITELWLGGDHYKWRLMRHNGIPETHITGNAPDYEKFDAFCNTIEKCIGNPVYHWAHLEMQKYFDYDGIITGAKSKELYDLCNKRILQEDFCVQNLIKSSGVEWIGTTDDPADTLEHHLKLQKNNVLGLAKVLPSFRPSNVLDIEKSTFVSYINRLGELTNTNIIDWDSLKNALSDRLDYFHSAGCRISDHSLEPPVYDSMATESNVNTALKKAVNGEVLSIKEINYYKTMLMIFLGREYTRRNWVMQLHMGAQRNNNTRMLKLVGTDIGFDSMSDDSYSLALNRLLDAMDENDGLPRTILYALNPNSDDMLAATIGNFAGRGIKGRMQWGSAWWFNDTKPGMIKHMTTLASHGILANFVGMLTDSRSFISYPRHEYFRRILANLLGNWVEVGEFPSDMELLAKIAKDISYYNAVEFFS